MENPMMNREAELEMREAMLASQRMEWTRKQNPVGKVMQSLVRAVMGQNYFPTRAIFSDFSHYNYKVSHAALKAEGGLGSVCKLGEVDDTLNPDLWLDNTFVRNCQDSYDAGGLFFGAYVFVNTAYWIRKQVTERQLDALEDTFDRDPVKGAQYAKAVFAQDPQITLIVRQLVIGDGWQTDPDKLRFLPKRKVDVLVLDVERWWMSYSDWYTNKGNAKRVDPFWIGKTTSVMLERLRHLMMLGYLPNIPIWIYTAGWFVEQYSPVHFKTVLSNHGKTWLAQYPFSDSVLLTIGEFRSKYLSKLADNWKPTYVYGTPVAYQLASTFKWSWSMREDGTPKAGDINVLLMTDAEARTYFKLSGTTPPDNGGDPGGDPGEEPTPLPNEQLKKIQDTLDKLSTSQAEMDAKLQQVIDWLSSFKG